MQKEEGDRRERNVVRCSVPAKMWGGCGVGVVWVWGGCGVCGCQNSDSVVKNVTYF